MTEEPITPQEAIEILREYQRGDEPYITEPDLERIIRLIRRLAEDRAD